MSGSGKKRNEKIRIVISDNNSNILSGIKSIIKEINSAEIIELKDSDKDDLQILNKHDADILIADTQTSKINRSLEKPKTRNKINLTPREKEILLLVCEEHTIKDIAKKLNISPSTIETHRKNLFVKLKVKSQSGLVREAIRYGFYVFD